MRILHVLASVLLATSAAAQPDHVALCHRTGDGAFHRIEVDASAVPAHLAHGDVLAASGACGDAPEFVNCGGFAGFPCPDGATCIDQPDDGCDPECGGADCFGICVTFPPVPCDRGECPDGFACLDDPRDDCDPDCGDTRCPTVCARLLPETCGGIAGFTCPVGATCFDDVGDSCASDCGADCLGTCGVFGPLPCTGRRGDDCPAGSICVDDDRDDCGPECDGDCPRICVTPVTPP